MSVFWPGFRDSTESGNLAADQQPITALNAHKLGVVYRTDVFDALGGGIGHDHLSYLVL